METVAITIPRIAVCNFCNRKRHVRTVTLLGTKYEACAEDELAIIAQEKNRINRKPYEAEE